MEAIQVEESKQILIAVTELQTNVRNMSEQLKEIGKIGQTVLEVGQSTKSAHLRIDDVKKDFEEKLKSQKTDYEEKIRDQKDNLSELKSHITWLWRSIGAGAISLIFGIILFYLQNFRG